MKRTLTLIIHGTFAKEADWWRLSADGHATFADQLEREMTRCGLSGTVWAPLLSEGFDYDAIAWTGENRHRDRIEAAQQLGTTLNAFAERVHATPNEPVVVNFVAHSHGGNVVLEALRWFNPNVRVGRIALLGTPLIKVRPAFRLARPLLSVWLSFLLVSFVVPLVFMPWITYQILGHNVPVSVLGIPLLIGYAWMFWLLGKLLDTLWRLPWRLREVAEWFGGKDPSLVYGPSRRELAKSLGKESILLLTSRNDEAGLLLQISCSPQALYVDYVKGLSRFERLLEAVFLRPLVYGIFLETTAWLLQLFSLGVPWWKALLFDFRATSQKDQPYYPPNLLVEEKIDILPIRVPIAAESVPPNHAVGNQSNIPGQLSGLPLSIQEVKGEISRQIHLRHSAYYENEVVIRRVAGFLTGGELRIAKQPVVPSSWWTSDGFWEVLAAANIALGIILARLFPTPQRSMLGWIVALFLGCYVFESILAGVPWLSFVLIRFIRRKLSSRAFWGGLVAGNVALGTILARFIPISQSLLGSIVVWFLYCCMVEFVLAGIPWLFFVLIRLIHRTLSTRLGR